MNNGKGTSARDVLGFSPDVKKLLGLRPDQKLPHDGLPKHQVESPFGLITIWVRPLGEKLHRWRRASHRVMASCPKCGEEMSLGRLHQHLSIHKEK